MERKIVLLLVCAVALLIAGAEAKKVHYIHWNSASPIFRIDNTDNVIDVNENDQANLICPVSKPGTRFPESHVIYSVSREEYDSCRITNPRPRIVAICNKPHRLMYFTITFRSFTPTPGGLEFRPGQDYYFISTSSREDLHRRVGGGCSTHNMKMIFKVRPSSSQPAKHLQLNTPRLKKVPVPVTSTPEVRQLLKEKQRVALREDLFYSYHPREVVALETAFSKVEREGLGVDDEITMSLTASAMSSSAGSPLSSAALVVAVLLSALRLR